MTRGENAMRAANETNSNYEMFKVSSGGLRCFYEGFPEDSKRG